MDLDPLLTTRPAKLVVTVAAILPLPLASMMTHIGQLTMVGPLRPTGSLQVKPGGQETPGLVVTGNKAGM